MPIVFVLEAPHGLLMRVVGVETPLLKFALLEGHRFSKALLQLIHTTLHTDARLSQTVAKLQLALIDLVFLDGEADKQSAIDAMQAPRTRKTKEMEAPPAQLAEVLEEITVHDPSNYSEIKLIKNTL